MKRIILVRHGRSSHLPVTWLEWPAHGGHTVAEPTVSRTPRNTMQPVPPDHDVIGQQLALMVPIFLIDHRARCRHRRAGWRAS